MISDSDAIAQRLEGALDRLEAVLAKKEAENQRLRRIEAAAAEALADLDELLAEPARRAAAG